MYTVIDVETTGGAAGLHRITEIAIVRFDGARVTERFDTLVNPGVDIPGFITSLTGISNSMVRDAPYFHEIGPKVQEFTADCVFVAHNVNFDYGFVKREFERLGMPFDRRKLCTVRLSRKILPGLPSYGLGSLCQHLGLRNRARHRAHGDAEVTALLLKHLLENDSKGFIATSLKKNSHEATLPPNLSKETYQQLPSSTGVYHFLDARGRVIYVGKALDIRSRVSGHFTGKSSQSKRLFMNSIHDVSYRETGNELIALLEESYEIKKYWPQFNRSQKSVVNGYGLYSYDDRDGYVRLFVNKIQKGNRPLASFSSFQDARASLYKFVQKFDLCPKLSGIQKTTGPCFDHQTGTCDGACAGKVAAVTYNKRVYHAVASFDNQLHNYAFLGKGRTVGERSVVLVKNGAYMGHGYFDMEEQITSVDQLESIIRQYPDNQDIQRILAMYLRKPGDQQVVDIKQMCPLPG